MWIDLCGVQCSTVSEGSTVKSSVEMNPGKIRCWLLELTLTCVQSVQDGQARSESVRFGLGPFSTRTMRWMTKLLVTVTVVSGEYPRAS